MSAAASFLSNGKIESPETGHASESAGKKSLASHYFLSSRVHGARSWRDKKLLSRSGRDRTRVLLGHWNFRCAAAGAEQLHSRRLCLRRAISSLNFVSCLATTVRATRSARQICMAVHTRNLLAAHDNNSDNKRCERRVSFYSPVHKIISSLNSSVISRLVLSASPLALPLSLSIQSAGPELKPPPVNGQTEQLKVPFPQYFGAAKRHRTLLSRPAFPEVGLGIRFCTLFLLPLTRSNFRLNAG
jgi:hypothetical protein